MRISLALRVFIPFALGYFLASILRAINAVIAPHLVRDLGLGAAELGFATGVFFLSTMLFQLPYGILLDRFDPRRTYAFFLIVSALGAVISAQAEGVLTLSLGRALIALGASASAVTSYKVYSLWYAPDRLPFVNGLSVAAGGLGVMTGTTPVELALGLVEWRDVHVIVGGLLVVAAALVLIAAPAKQRLGPRITLIQEVRGLGVIVKSLVFWRAAPLMMIVMGTFGGVTTLWAGPWVRDVAGMTGTAAANILLLMSGALTLSGLSAGWLTTQAKRFGLSLMSFVAVAAGLVLLVLIVLCLQWARSETTVLITWFLFGFLAPLNFVTFAALATQFPRELVGRLNACLSLFWMLGGFAVQNIYGLVLERFPSTNGSYAVEGHQLGMGVLVLLLIAALTWYLASSHMLKNHDPDPQP